MCMCKSIRWGLRKLIRVEEESEVGRRRIEAGMLGENVRERPKPKKTETDSRCEETQESDWSEVGRTGSVKTIHRDQ